MNARVPSPPSMKGIKLAGKARDYHDRLTDADKVALLKIPSRSYAVTKSYLGDLAVEIEDRERNVKDVEVLGLIMGLVRSNADDADFDALQKDLSGYFPSVTKASFNGAKSYCAKLVTAKKAEKNLVLGGPIVGETDYDFLVKYAEDRLEHQPEPKLFRHGTSIAKVVTVSEEDMASIQILDCDGLTAAFPAKFRMRVGENSFRNIAPPREVMMNLHKRAPELRMLPYLSGIVRVPVFGERGQLHTTPGYDPTSRVFYAPPADLYIPPVGDWRDAGARERDVSEAKRLIVEELLGDFRFDGWHRTRIMDSFFGKSDEPLPASIMNAVGLLLEPFCRAMIAGPTPAVLATKPVKGTGATTLIAALQMVASGTQNIRAPLSSSEEERRKMVYTVVQTAEPIVLFDNQKATVDSPTLAALLTSTTFTDRTLGKSEECSVPVRSTFTFTTNNARFSDELQRRLSLIRLDAKMADPTQRDDYRHEDLAGWISTNRGKLVWACLTLIRNWIEDGCQPPDHCPVVASYTGWSYVIGGILEAADMSAEKPVWTRFQANRSEIETYAAAGEDDGFEQLVSAWYEETRGAPKGADIDASSLAEIVDNQEIQIEGVKTTRDGNCNPASLGAHLRARLSSRFMVDEGGTEVELVTKGKSKKGVVWSLQVATEEGIGNDAEEAAAAAKADAPKGPQVPRTYRAFPLKTKPSNVVQMPMARGDDGGDDGVTAESTSSPDGPVRRRGRRPTGVHDLFDTGRDAPSPSENPFARGKR